MKQYISKSQLDELTGKQKEELFGWYHRSKGIKCFRVGTHMDMHEVAKEKMAVNSDKFNIGQMIEFLEENNSIDLIRKSPIGNEWIINHPTTFGVEYIDKELCNCLWEAVKEVLLK